MPITFTVIEDDCYFMAEWKGPITDEEMLSAYRDFFAGEKWLPGLNELADLSAAELSAVSTAALRKLALLIESTCTDCGVAAMRCAAYAPADLSFGLLRMYEVFCDYSPETTKTFRDRRAAEEWLIEQGNRQPPADAGEA